MQTFSVRILAEGEGPTPVQMLQALPRQASPVLLDSSNGSGWTFLGWNPDKKCRGRLRPGALKSAKGPSGRWPISSVDPGAALEDAWKDEVWCLDDPSLPLGPAWMGWLSFESGHAWEPFPWTPQSKSTFPDWDFSRYRGGVLFAPDGRFKLLWAEAEGERVNDRQRWESDFQRLLVASDAQIEEPETLVSEVGQASFERRVETLREWIGRGDLFQANLSHRMLTSPPFDSRALYSGVRATQPTSMSAYWEDAGGKALLSWSPELFLSVDGNLLETRPIKGTASRSSSEEEDSVRASSLEASPKEVSELSMIVDMARHDLGRLALPGGVDVLSTGELEAFPTLFHRTAQIRAQWNADDGISSLLRATFPPASITGAPKVRALQAIAELEQVARGPYCGTLGWWRPGLPQGAFSVLIRTAEVCSKQLALSVGAGIVWDSDPTQEWEETLLKASFLGQCTEAPTKALCS